jgi:hypothetical protein
MREMHSKKLIIFVMAFLIVMLSAACQANDDPYGKEILNMERNFAKSEYEERYKTSFDEITVKKKHVYTFDFSATLSSGSINIAVVDANNNKLWNKEIKDSDYQEKVSLSDIPPGICKIVIDINEDTEGHIAYIVKEKKK